MAIYGRTEINSDQFEFIVSAMTEHAAQQTAAGLKLPHLLPQFQEIAKGGDVMAIRAMEIYNGNR